MSSTFQENIELKEAIGGDGTVVPKYDLQRYVNSQSIKMMPACSNSKSTYCTCTYFSRPNFSGNGCKEWLSTN